MKSKQMLLWLGTLSILLYIFTLSSYSITTDELVGYWKFDQKNNLGKDSSQYKNDGKSEGKVEWESNGKYGGALKIDGKGSIVVESSPSLEVTNTVTIAVWCRFDKIVNLYQRPIFKNGPNPDNFASYSIALMRSELLTGSFFFDAITDKGRVNNAGPTPPKEGVWIHIAGVYTGSELRLYVDGKLDKGVVGGFANPQKQSGKIVKSKAPLSLGSEKIWNTAVYHGLIDEAAVFSAALTDKEIKELFGGTVEEFLNVQPKGKLTTLWGQIKQTR